MSISVLVTDDSKFMREMLKRILPPQYEVVGEASDGEEAVEMYGELEPDVVTLDMVMPEVDGIEATERIKEEDPEATVIVCSSVGQKEKVGQAVEAGADGYLNKSALESVGDSKED